MLHVNHLYKSYHTGSATYEVLKDVNLTVEKGEFVAVTGKSGSGKTTLLQMLGGLDRPTSGTVHVDGKNLAEMSKDSLTVFRRRKVGFIFQNYNLVPDLTVYENVVFPIELDGAYIDRDYIERILFMLKLQKKTEALPHMISGGEQQRAAIARALATKPSIILADEPTGNLDTVASHDVLGLLKMAAEEFRQTIVLITHDQDIAQMADRIVRIEDGRIVKGCGMDAGE